MSRAVTTVEELDALPRHSVVTRNRVPYFKDESGWHIVGAAVYHNYSAASLLLNDNATVISEPEA